MRLPGRSDLPNIAAVARREFVVRARTRTFVLSTLILVAAALAVGLAPVVISYLTQGSTSVAVYVGPTDLRGDPVATVDTMLNPPGSGGASADGPKAYAVRPSTDLAADRELVRLGSLDALLEIERGSSGDLAFTVYTDEPANGRTGAISSQAAANIATADRLDRLGLDATARAMLFAAPDVTFRGSASSAAPTGPTTLAQEVVDAALITVLELFLLLAIVLYGTWIAQSVVEEKSSRMMEIVLAAATPLQVLAGKVLGVSAAALLQYVAVVAAVVTALVLQGPVAGFVLGQTAGSLPAGLTPQVVVAFSLFFVLGFALYAVLFAAVASLVSRQEDVNQIVTPLTLAASAGYLVAVYASIGMLDSRAPWLVALSWVPFLSPYMMLSRFSEGSAGAPEVVAAVIILAATVVLVTWLAARIYAAGVLMYGQKPGVRAVWKALRQVR